jgi:hypothetical protein
VGAAHRAAPEQLADHAQGDPRRLVADVGQDPLLQVARHAEEDLLGRRPAVHQTPSSAAAIMASTGSSWHVAGSHTPPPNTTELRLKTDASSVLSPRA